MLEILALIFLTRNIGNITIQKGLKSGTWKLYTVLAWFGAEILGIVAGFALGGEDGFALAFLLGIGFALSSFFILRASLKKRPDAMDEEINSIGVEDLYPPKNPGTTSPQQ
ncbi:MAG: hypothetical protein U0V75_03160 [Ferruginibacter sp.]